MMQGRIFLPLALAATLAAPAMHAKVADAAPRKPAAASSSTPRKKSVALHQFSGVLTAVDKTSLTVEKSGKAAKTMVFTRLAGMSTTGELEKDVRVTVWYRDENGQPVAHRVVVKTAPLTANR